MNKSQNPTHRPFDTATLPAFSDNQPSVPTAELNRWDDFEPTRLVYNDALATVAERLPRLPLHQRLARMVLPPHPLQPTRAEQELQRLASNPEVGDIAAIVGPDAADLIRNGTTAFNAHLTLRRGALWLGVSDGQQTAPRSWEGAVDQLNRFLVLYDRPSARRDDNRRREAATLANLLTAGGFLRTSTQSGGGRPMFGTDNGEI